MLGGDPETVLAVFKYAGNGIAVDRGRIERMVIPVQNLLAIVAVETVDGANPEIAEVILIDAGDVVAGEAVRGGQTLEAEGAILCKGGYTADEQRR
ncbi:MAG TPA: hypothetical protein PLG50_09475 [bacterium]|nr:hypothetical protein [bacterium]